MINEGKPRLSLIPKSATWAAAEAFTYGASKHGDYSWTKGSHTMTQMLDKALRHLTQFQDGEDNDKESKLLHLASVLADVSIAVDLYYNYNYLDDRNKRPVTNNQTEDIWINEKDETAMVELETGDTIVYPDGKEFKVSTEGTFPIKPNGKVIFK